MGIYNCANTLAQALDSLMAQTFQDFKVIMCDDGSADDTYEVASGYVERYPAKFILLKNKINKGLGYTLNHCLDYVDTEFVARMDGDDISLPARFKSEVDFLDSHPDIAIVSTPMTYFDESGDFKTGTGGGYYPVADDFVKGTPFCHAPCMVRAAAYRAVDGYSDTPGTLQVEDYDLWFKMYAKGFRGYVLPKVLYKMRDDRNAIARRTFRRRINEFNVRRKGYKMLSIPCYKRIWMFRPILVALIPGFIYKYLHRRR